MMAWPVCYAAQRPAFLSQFTGKERDAETGLDYFLARYYSGAQGRFLSTDPIIMGPHKASNPQNWNLYSYGINNPMKFTDPTGEIIEDAGCMQDKKCRQWKEELLGTEWGRNIWKKYDEDKNFILTITMGKNAGGDQGGETMGYGWKSSGELIAATIILGKKLDSGYPAGDNYPITGSLRGDPYGTAISGRTLAATKMAHEFGHVETTAATSQELFNLQNYYSPIYDEILRTTGRRTSELSEIMGGTPDQIHTSRERSAEALGAVPFLRDRFPGRSGERMPNRVRQAIENFEKGK